MLKIAQEEGKRWKDELNKFLLAYRTTPHSTTGMTPASLMFGRELKTKLPELRPNKSMLDESFRDRDWKHKLSSKFYADKQRNATFNPVVPGDKVLLKVLLKRISKVAFLYLKCFFNLRRTLINNQNVHNPEEAALIGA